MHKVKDILESVDDHVAQKELEMRQFEIYNKTDAKSTAHYRGRKFKKSDILTNNRKLRFEGVLGWKSARGKVVDVLGVILSDVILFLQECNQRYQFISLDNKVCNFSLR